MATRRRVDGKVQDAITELALGRDWSPAQIHKELGRRFDAKLVPDQRTVQRIVADLRPLDPSGPWRLAAADPDEARVVLPALAEVLERTEGRHALTNAEAEHIARLRRASPELGPWHAYQIARLYLSMRDVPDLVAALDAAIAFEPWRGGEHRARYERALATGWLPFEARTLGAIAWSMGLDAIPHQVPIQVVVVDEKGEARDGKTR